MSEKRLEGQANDLPAAFAPEELESIVPEEKTNSLQVRANPHHIAILHIIHLANQYRAAENIQETCVKLFKNRAEFVKSKPSDA